MGETRTKFDREFREGAVLPTGKPLGHVTEDPGINEGTLGNWGAPRRTTSARQRPGILGRSSCLARPCACTVVR